MKGNWYEKAPAGAFQQMKATLEEIEEDVEILERHVGGMGEMQAAESFGISLQFPFRSGNSGVSSG